MAVEISGDFMDLVAKMPRGERSAPTVTSHEYARPFGTVTAQIVCSVRRTRRKLERLSQLVRRSSLFEDATEEISGLIHNANEEVTAASTSFRTARSELGKSRDFLSDKQKQHHGEFTHVTAMEAATQLEIEETSRFFQAILRRRRETMRQQHERREFFGKSRENQVERSRIPIFDDVLPRPVGTAPRDEKKSDTHKQQQMDLLIPDQTYHSSRATATADVEAQVQEIGNIFGKLTSLISQHDELVERIEANVEEASHNVDATATVLRDRLSHMSDTTTTAIKVAGILAATAVIYTVFLA